MDVPWTGEEAYFDRVLYVFGCNTRTCTEEQGRKAWRAFVIQTPAVSKAKAEPAAAQAGLWDTIMAAPKAVEAEMTRLTLDEPVAAVDDQACSAAVYDKAYPVGFAPIRLHIVEEMIVEKRKPARDSDDEQIPSAFAGVGEGEDWSGEAYEQAHPMGVDKAFLGFQQRIQSYPRQVARFSPAGSPLLFCQEAIASPGVCPVCSQKRVFELQLMPAILSLLPTNDAKHLQHIPAAQRGQHPVFGDGMEWGTMLIFTCGTCTRDRTRPTVIEAGTFTQIE